MRIHEIDVYNSQEILAFIEYLKVKAEQQKKMEDMQSQYSNGLIGANFLNQASGAAATPEYIAKEVARKSAVAQQMAAAVKDQDTN